MAKTANTSEHSQPAPVVWLLTDNKPGHRNQLKGLGNRLRVLAGVSLHWVDAKSLKIPLWRTLLGRAPKIDSHLPRPNLIIGAGTGTHRLLLALRRLKNTKTLVIMKPVFPLNLVDGAIIPAHDGVRSGDRVLVTEGVINTITPLARITDKPEALILVGGPSPHYLWDSDSLLGQINYLIGHYPQWRWTISGSRRTPKDLLARLEALASQKITVVDPATTHPDWLSLRLAASKAVWVSPDSVSMVCESATSGVPTGLFQLPEHSDSRVARGISNLIREGRVGCWSDHVAVMAGKTGHNQPLWEADRVARWILDQGLLSSEGKTHQNAKRKID